MIAIYLTRQQYAKLSDILDDAQDEGPAGHGWASEELRELQEILAKVETRSIPDKMPKNSILRSKPQQIQAVSQPGDGNSGPHVQLFALCEDGSIWVQYHSSGFSNVPTDGMWHMIQPLEPWEYST